MSTILKSLTMKNLILFSFLFIVQLGCNEAPKSTPVTTVVVSDSSAIADAVHGFYQFYNTFYKDKTKNVDFTDDKGKHLKLIQSNLEAYYGHFKSSGVVSSDFVTKELVYYKNCETLWQKEEKGDQASCFEADRYYCSQEEPDFEFYTKAPIKFKSLGNNMASAAFAGTSEGNPSISFELVKEGDKWLVSKIECTVEENQSTPVQDLVNQLAAFYTGTTPCMDCDGITTLLTLNADEKRTFSLEEQYKGKKSKTVESKGTWAFADGIVTLNGDSGSRKYQMVEDGLVSLNADGSKRDAKSAKKYLLKKVMGE